MQGQDADEAFDIKSSDDGVDPYYLVSNSPCVDIGDIEATELIVDSDKFDWADMTTQIDETPDGDDNLLDAGFHHGRIGMVLTCGLRTRYDSPRRLSQLRELRGRCQLGHVPRKRA